MPSAPETPPTAAAPPPQRRWPRRLALAAVLVAGGALRLAYGWPDPSGARDYDSRFVLPNVESILRHHRFLPVSAYHPSLSFLPQAAVLGAVEACGCLELGTGTRSVLRPAGGRPPRTRARGGGPALAAVSPLAYRTCRIVQSLLGVGALALLSVLAARVLGPWRGVAAAALLAFVPWHLWTAGACNEEAAFFVAVEVAALATLSAARRDDLGGYALAGVAFGCALASKLNAGPVTLPLAVWTLARARRAPRRVALLATAAAVSVVTFVALNPHFVTRFDLVRRDFGYTVRHYQEKAVAASTGHFDVLVSGLAAPAAPEYLGLALALLALVGLAVAARPASGDPRRHGELRLLALFPLTYVPVYALITRHVKDHNWLPVLPFAIVLALAGAGALVAAARRAGGRRLAAAALALAIAAALPVAARGTALVYGAVVPDTLELALRRLAPSVPRGRVILIRDVAGDRRWVGRRASRKRLLEVELPAGDAGLAAGRLAAADFWILERATARRLGLASGAAFEVAPRLFSARGPALTAGGQRWRRLGAGQPAALRQSWGRAAEVEVPLGPLPAGTRRVSLRFGVVGGERDSRCTVRPGAGAARPAHRELVRRTRPVRALDREQPRAHAGELFFTERLDPAGASTVVVRCTGERPRRITTPVEVRFWAPPAESQSTFKP